MKFKSAVYFAEMKPFINDAIEKLANNNPEFEIYTVALWTDANAAVSAISFDSKLNSDEHCRKSNEFNEKQKEYWTSRGDIKMAELFTAHSVRNCNPADFELRNYLKIENRSFPRNWEEKTGGNCWEVLEPVLKEIGEYLFQALINSRMHSDLEVGVNGSLDWYQFTWTKPYSL